MNTVFTSAQKLIRAAKIVFFVEKGRQILQKMQFCEIYFHSNVLIKWSMSFLMKLMTGCIESLSGLKLK